jgi:hypothetical protein
MDAIAAENIRHFDWNHRRSDIHLRDWRSISIKEIAMFKIAVVAFALAVSGFMLWVAHVDANFAQLPHATLVKRAA